MTKMLAPNRSALLAAAAFAMLAMPPMNAQARDAVSSSVAAPSQTTAARAELAAPKIQRHRRTANRHVARQIAAVQSPSGPHCFLFWCSNRPLAAPWLVLGVAY